MGQEVECKARFQQRQRGRKAQLETDYLYFAGPSASRSI